MGFSLSWVAVKGGTPQDVLNELCLRPTGARAEIPETAADGAALPGGWYLVVSNRDELKLTEEATLKSLSYLGEAIACFVEEHVMVSTAMCYSKGAWIWTVKHDAQKGADHLRALGKPPAEFAAIRDRLLKEQAEGDADVDYVFEIPVELAQALTGFRHDEAPPGAEGNAEPFEVLERGKKKKSQGFFVRIPTR